MGTCCSIEDDEAKDGILTPLISAEESAFALMKPVKRFGAAAITEATQNFLRSELLGEGTFGAVYKAVIPLPDGRPCAVKVVKPGGVPDTAYEDELFELELEFLRRCAHPNIVGVYGFYDPKQEGVTEGGTVAQHHRAKGFRWVDFMPQAAPRYALAPPCKDCCLVMELMTGTLSSKLRVRLEERKRRAKTAGAGGGGTNPQAKTGSGSTWAQKMGLKKATAGAAGGGGGGAYGSAPKGGSLKKNKSVQALSGLAGTKEGGTNESGSSLTANERLLIASDIGRALAHMHNCGVVHRDVKSANILIHYNPYTMGAPGSGTMGLVAKLTDLGSARELKTIAPWSRAQDVARPGERARASAFEATRVVVGTSAYMPFEYLQSGIVSAKTDAYAYGVLLLELLTGLPPVSEGSAEALASEMHPILDQPVELLQPWLDRSAGGWPFDKARKLAALARGCIEQNAATRVEVRYVGPEVDRLAEAFRNSCSGGAGGGTLRLPLQRRLG